MDTHATNTPDCERGSILLLFALSLTAVFLILAMSVDLGSAYITHSRLSQSVDAGVLAGARNSAQSNTKIKAIALQVARANFVGDHPVDYSLSITTPARDTKRFLMTAQTKATGAFSAAALGAGTFDVSVLGEATRYPLDMSLVLDLSFSLQRNRAFKDMQTAASGFLNYFDNSADQIGIATYSTWAEEKLPVQKFFQLSGSRIIRRLHAISDTNIQEGLRVSKSQLDAAQQRPGALKIVVLFTDGRPTAYRDTFHFRRRSCRRYDSIVAAYVNGSSYRGLFRWTDGRRIKSFRSRCRTRTAANQSSTRSVVPREISRYSRQGDFIRAQGILKSEEQANLIREAGYSIYSIALGNPNARIEGDKPDLDFLARITNQGGLVNANQPRGELIFAPSPAELEDAFSKLADRLLTRLTR